MAKQPKRQFSYPAAIAVAVVLSGLVMAKFQSAPPKNKASKRSHLTRRVGKHNLKPSTESPVMKLEGALAGVSTQVQNSKKTEAEPSQGSRDNCFSNLKKLGAVFSPSVRTKTANHIKIGAQKQKVLKKAKVVAKKSTLPFWIETDLEQADLSSQDALDNPAPVDVLTEKAFAESEVIAEVAADKGMAAFHWDVGAKPEFLFESELRLYAQESEFQLNDFAELKGSLAQLKDSQITLGLLEAPKSKVAWRELNLEEIEKPSEHSSQEVDKEALDSQKVAAETSSQEAVRESEVDSEEVTTTQTPIQGKPSLNAGEAPAVVERGPDPSRQEISEDSGQKPKVRTEPETELLSPLSPSLGSVSSSLPQLLARAWIPTPKPPASPVVTTQEAPVQNTEQSMSRDSQSRFAVTQQKSVEPQNPVSDNQEDNDSVVEGKIYGRFDVDAEALSWIRARKGHIELYLNKEGSNDPQDTIFFPEYQFPKSGLDFEFDGTGLRGKYKLVAGVYTPDSAVPLAQITYPKTLSSESWKEKILFSIRKDAIHASPLYEESQRNADFVPLNLTLFEGAPGNYRSPKAIPEAEVHLVGFPQLGRFKSNRDGNVRIPRVPVASEVVVEARAEGFYPTRQIVPIFSSTAYSPIYLIQRDKVEVITGFFTKRPQQDEKGLLMGRVYDLKTRAPLSGETVSLSNRRGNAVYFGALPDMSANATLATGLFGFFNVESSMRALGRGANKHPLVMNVEPGYGYFVEPGRGGSKNLKGQLVDPFTSKNVFSMVQMIGGAQDAIETSETGHFKIPDVDLPPGVLTLEVAAEGYPRTWYTLPWSSREAEKPRKLYMIERDLIKESAARVARIKHEKNTGVILGGADASLFKKGRKQIGLSLMDKRGNVMGPEYGPYALSQTPRGGTSFMLSSKNPGFTFYNLQPGEYILHMKDETGSIFRTHVVRVGVERVSIVVN